MSWSLEQAYQAFPGIEDEFAAALDQSLLPRGPDVLFDFVAQLDLPAHAAALDVGCGPGTHSLVLARRFGFTVTGIDPVASHVASARAAAAAAAGTAGAAGADAAFVLGAAEQI